MTNYDIVIIGSGPGGYVAALYAARHKLNVCVAEMGLVGGTCLNRGCIPTKSLLHSASLLTMMQEASHHGISPGKITVDFQKMQSRKKEVITKLRTGIETLFRANKIELIRGRARILSPNTVEIDGFGPVTGRNIIIATGSVPGEIPGITIDRKSTLSSDEILDLEALPEKLSIIGGGVIGCEFASLYSALGVKVAVVELADRLISTQSREASKKLEVIFKKRGIEVLCSQRVDKVDVGGTVTVKTASGKVIESGKALVSAGRKPVIEGLADFNALGITVESGRIRVDKTLRTAVPNIYAIGDCVTGPQLAHKASYDGICVVNSIIGNAGEADYSNIPNCIWTDPQIASVGTSEDAARASNPDVKTAKFPYMASGKAFIMGRSEGYVKITGDKEGNILGVEILGEEACDLIGEACLAKSMGIKIKDWAGVVHGHPTLSELLQEAAHVFCGTAIHSI